MLALQRNEAQRFRLGCSSEVKTQESLVSWEKKNPFRENKAGVSQKKAQPIKDGFEMFWALTYFDKKKIKITRKKTVIIV